MNLLKRRSRKTHILIDWLVDWFFNNNITKQQPIRQRRTGLTNIPDWLALVSSTRLWCGQLAYGTTRPLSWHRRLAGNSFLSHRIPAKQRLCSNANACHSSSRRKCDLLPGGMQGWVELVGLVAYKLKFHGTVFRVTSSRGCHDAVRRCYEENCFRVI